MPAQRSVCADVDFSGGYRTPAAWARTRTHGGGTVFEQRLKHLGGIREGIACESIIADCGRAVAVKLLSGIAECTPFAMGATAARRADGPDSPASWLGAYKIEGILGAIDGESGARSLLRPGVPYAVVAVIPLQNVRDRTRGRLPLTGGSARIDVEDFAVRGRDQLGCGQGGMDGMGLSQRPRRWRHPD